MGERTYRGLPGAFPYALRASDSSLFRSYVLLGGLAALLVAIAFVLALVDLLGATSGVGGGTFSFSRAFLVFVGFLAVAPLVAPILVVARRHRRTGSDRRFDATMAVLGYAFVGSLYVALVISAPPARRDPATGLLAPLIEALYAAPPLAGLLPPAAIAAVMWAVARS